MNNIDPVYHNDFGVAFQLKRSSAADMHKIQLVFRNIGLLFTYAELKQFCTSVAETIDTSKLCGKCSKDKDCKSLLLQTPIDQLSFAMSMVELLSLEELIQGTLFQLELNQLLYRND